MIAAYDGKMLGVDARLEPPIDRLEKVVAVILHVEPDEVGAEHAFDDLLLPRTDAEGLEIGPRNVPEDPDTRVRTPRLDDRWQKREMVILDQHERRIGVVHLLQQRLGELLVH